jgi:hypothetical protein
MLVDIIYTVYGLSLILDCVGIILAKATLSTMYFNCVQGLNKIQKECWHICHNKDNDPTINQWHKIAALKLAAEINDKKFGIFTSGPAFMNIGRLERLTRNALPDRHYMAASINRFLVKYNEKSISTTLK